MNGLLDNCLNINSSPCIIDSSDDSSRIQKHLYLIVILYYVLSQVYRRLRPFCTTISSIFISSHDVTVFHESDILQNCSQHISSGNFIFCSNSNQRHA